MLCLQGRSAGHQQPVDRCCVCYCRRLLLAMLPVGIRGSLELECVPLACLAFGSCHSLLHPVPSKASPTAPVSCNASDVLRLATWKHSFVVGKDNHFFSWGDAVCANHYVHLPRIARLVMRTLNLHCTQSSTSQFSCVNSVAILSRLVLCSSTPSCLHGFRAAT